MPLPRTPSLAPLRIPVTPEAGSALCRAEHAPTPGKEELATDWHGGVPLMAVAPSPLYRARQGGRPPRMVRGRHDLGEYELDLPPALGGRLAVRHERMLFKPECKPAMRPAPSVLPTMSADDVLTLSDLLKVPGEDWINEWIDEVAVHG
jgi:hypothetical protein